MSLEQLRRAFATPCQGPGQQLLLIVLADLADDSGTRVYPSQATLAERCRIDVRTVRRFLSDLLQSGHIALTTPALGRAPAVYRLLLERAPRPLSTPGISPTPDGSPGQSGFVDRTSTSGDRTTRPPIPSESLRDPKSADARARVNGAPLETGQDARPPLTPEAKAAMKARALGRPPDLSTGNGAHPEPTSPLVKHPMTETEALLETERRRRQAAATADSLAAGKPVPTRTD